MNAPVLSHLLAPSPHALTARVQGPLCCLPGSVLLHSYTTLTEDAASYKLVRQLSKLQVLSQRTVRTYLNETTS